MPPITVPDEFTIHQVRALTPQLIKLARSGESLELDLSGVSRIDSAGMQLLLAVRRESARACTHLALANPSPAVSELMNFYQLERVLGTHVVAETV